ncbi:MAG: DegV family protein, partial [Clostridium sp.]|nr:DegV family protein [Clostridium sp.]
KVASVAGSVFGIRPVITLKEGEIFASGVGRSRKSTVAKARNLLLTYLKEQNANIKDYSITIGFGYDYEEAVRFRDETLEALRAEGYSVSEEELPVRQIGATISVHTGPYPLGFGVLEKSIH